MAQQITYYPPLDTLNANVGYARFWKNKDYNKNEGTLKILPSGPVVINTMIKHDDTKG
jgi:hypothetical protein